MSAKDDKIRWEKVLNAHERIESGFYDIFEEEINEAIVYSTTLRRELLMGELEMCPIGDGRQYHNIVTTIMEESLGDIVDCELVRQEFSAQGGRGDIELPICIEKLQEYPLWEAWCHRYIVKSILIEVKNMKTKANFQDVGQLEHYLNVAKKGRFGILISRSGFTKNAIKSLHLSATDNQNLILPLSHCDLKLLLELSMRGKLEVMKFLRQKETRLLQVA